MIRATVLGKTVNVRGRTYRYGRIENLPSEYIGREVIILTADEYRELVEGRGGFDYRTVIGLIEKIVEVEKKRDELNRWLLERRSI